ncbi:MAG: PAS domain-containing sensor histidine kinase [Oceanospirillaceae bacterium]|nr:PAS domain-containing sensor histidine kinase [Oceanospirillaceae bacterium]
MDKNNAQINTLTFAWIADSIPALACYVDSSLSYRFMNARYRKMFSLADDIDVTSHSMPSLLGERGFSGAQDKVNKVLQGEFVSYEYRLKTGTGEKVLQVHYVPDFEENEHPDKGVRGFFMMALDVTELRLTQENYKRDLQVEVESKTQHLSQAMQELRSAQNQLFEQERMASLGTLVSGVAHELNTPIGTSLTAISSLKDKSIELKEKLDNKTLTNADLSKHLEHSIEILSLTQSNVMKASELIQTFKSVSTSETIEDATICNLSVLVENIIALIIPAFSDKNISLTLKVDEKLELLVHPMQMFQIFNHLIHNSYQHGFMDDKDNAISIFLMLKEDTLHIEYSDNGVGLNKEAKKHLFDPFFTTRPTSESTGLGMTILYNIIKGPLSGEILVDRKLNKGIKIDIYIPCTSCPVSQRPVFGAD